MSSELVVLLRSTNQRIQPGLTRGQKSAWRLPACEHNRVLTPFLPFNPLQPLQGFWKWPLVEMKYYYPEEWKQRIFIFDNVHWYLLIDPEKFACYPISPKFSDGNGFIKLLIDCNTPCIVTERFRLFDRPRNGLKGLCCNPSTRKMETTC